MALATRCVACGTVFRISREQAALRQGMVRCGACNDVFNALEHLVYVRGPDEGPDHAGGNNNANAASPASSSTSGSTGSPSSRSGSGNVTVPPPSTLAAPAALPTLTVPGRAPVSSPVPIPSMALPVAPPPAAISAPMSISVPSAARPPVTERRERGNGGEVVIPHMTALFGPLSAPVAAPAPAMQESARLGRDEIEEMLADRTEPLFSTESLIDHAGAQNANLADASHLSPERFSFLTPQRERLPLSLGGKVFFGLLSLICLLTLAAQAAYVWRDDLASAWPPAKPWLVSVCLPLRCHINLPARPEQISIESSEFHPVQSGRDAYVLSMLMRSHSLVPLRYPQLELTLTDAEGQLLTRRVFSPDEYLSSLPGNSSDVAGGITPNAEVSVRLIFQLAGIKAVGYSVGVFYP